MHPNAADKHQKKSHLNGIIARMLSERCSLRGISRCLSISYSTVYRKFLWLAEQNKVLQKPPSCHSIWFDEMETFEHTKLKPLGISLIVDENYKIHQAIVGCLPRKVT